MVTDNSENLVAEVLEIQQLEVQGVQEVNVRNRNIGRLGLSGRWSPSFSAVCGAEAIAKYVQDIIDSEKRINARRRLLAARKPLG